ncbi:hypothetical protein D3C72_1356910 [compost metagenome]
MGNGRLQLAVVRPQPAGAHIVHPGATAFAVARRRVQVELAYQFAIALDAVELHCLVPHGGKVLLDLHAEQGLYDAKQPCQHLGGREVLLELLLAEGIARFLQMLADIAPVPGLRVGQAQLCAGVFAQVLHVLFAKGFGLAGQFLQEVQHLLR